jgi:hypothetical protein
MFIFFFADSVRSRDESLLHGNSEQMFTETATPVADSAPTIPRVSLRPLARLDNGPGDSVQSMMIAAVHGLKCFHPPREINITLGLHKEGSDGAGCDEQNAALPRTPWGSCWNTCFTRDEGHAGIPTATQ